MKIEKISEKSYRVRKQINGQKIILTFDHKPTDIDVIRALSNYVEDMETPVVGSFQSCAVSYIESKTNVISPKTIKTYYSLLDSSIDKEFKNKRINRITQLDIQNLINKYAESHSPKTVHNLHGFVAGVMKQFRPNMNIHTTLPQKRPHEPYTPSEDDIRRILEASKSDLPNHICFQLGVMGMRRSEILALTISDLKGNTLTIDKAMVQNKDGQWVIKSTKTAAGTRKLFVPDSLVKEIKKQGYIYNRHPNKMYRALVRYQDKLGIPHFRFHDLRHFFASYAHSQGISDADIMASGGWKSDYTMKQIYRHEMNVEEAQKKIFTSLVGNWGSQVFAFLGVTGFRIFREKLATFGKRLTTQTCKRDKYAVFDFEKMFEKA